MTPALMIILSVSATDAVGTDLATILATSSLGIIKRYKSGTVDFRLAGTIACGCVPGVIVGKMILARLKKMNPLSINGYDVVAVQFILLCLFVLLLLWIAYFLISDFCRNRNNNTDKNERIGYFVRLKLPPYATYKSLGDSKLSIMVLVMFGCFVGILTGMMGIGGGIIMLPTLIYLIGQPATKAVGTSLLLVWTSSLVAVLLNGKDGNIIYSLLAAMMVGGLSGTLLGTKIGLSAKETHLRLGFVGVVLVAILLIGTRVLYIIFGK